MPGRPHERSLGLGHGEPKGVTNLSGGHFVETDQTRKNRKACRVGRGPSAWPERMRSQVEYGAGARFPASIGLREAGKGFVEGAVVSVQHQHVTIPRGRAAALDRRVRRERIGTRVAFVRIIKNDLNPRLASGDDDMRDPDRTAGPYARAKIRVYALARPDRGDIGRGIRMHGQMIDPGVPDVIRRKDGTPCQGRPCLRESALADWG